MVYFNMGSLREEEKKSSWVDNNRLLFNHESSKEKIFILVEGDSDRRFFYKIFNKYTNKVVIDSPESGKPEVIKAVKDIRRLNHSNIYGICDTDFDYLMGNDDYSDNDIILFTDFHDLEITIISLGVFDDIYNEYTIFDSLKPEDASTLKNNIFDSAYKIGILKLINSQNSLNLNFNTIRHSRHIHADGVNITVDIESIIDHLISCSRGFNNQLFNKERILDIYNTLIIAGHDEKHVCNGHDFCEILALCYKQDFSRDKLLNRAKLESDLRIACTLERFRDSILYSSLREILIRHHVVQ